MRNNQQKGYSVTRRLICLLLVFVLSIELLPLSVTAAELFPGKHDGVLVEFDTAENAMAFASRYDGRVIADLYVQVQDGTPTDGAAGVVSVCKNGYLEAEAYVYETAPNDARYGEQWAMSGTNIQTGWNRGERALQNKSVSPGAVTVAVLDTGIDGTHPDLVGRVGDGYDAMTGEVLPGNTDSDCSEDSHGTMVAGIIAASAYNEIGIAGAAGMYPVTVLPVRVLNSKGNGTIADIVAGIYWAIENDVDIINMSFGKRLSYYPAPLAQAVTDAVDAGILVFTAAGNDGRSDIDDCYPACLTGIHPVGAYEQNGTSYKMCAFSNGYYEKVTGGFYCGPGRDVLTTVKGGEYGLFTGTSASCAFVSGFAAFVTSVDLAKGMRSPRNVETIMNECITSPAWYVRVLDLSRIYVSDFNIYEPTTKPEFSVSVPEVVFGNEEVTVAFTQGAELVAEVAIVCQTENGLKKVLLKNDGTDPTEYRAEFDFSELADGAYQLYACCWLKSSGEYEDWWRWYNDADSLHRSTLVTVRKPGESSLLHLTDLSGGAMGNQTFYVIDPVSGETVRTRTTDQNGYGTIPADCFKNGEAIIACYSTELFYRHRVQQATEIELGGMECPTRTVMLLGPDGEPVSGARIYAAMPDDSLLLGTTGEDGCLTIAAENGAYSFAALSGGGTDPASGVLRALLLADVEFSDEVSTLCMNASVGSCELSIPELPSENVEDAQLELTHNGMEFNLYALNGEPIYVTPGVWDMTLDYNWKHSQYSYTNYLGFALKNQQLSAGKQTLAVDPTHLKMCMDWRTEVLHPDDSFDYDLYLEDSFGNRMAYYTYVTTTVHGGEMEGDTYSYDPPSAYYFPQTDCDYTMDIVLMDVMSEQYPGVSYDVSEASVSFSYRLGKCIELVMPEGHTCWPNYSVFARKADGTTVKLNSLGNEKLFNAQDLEYGTPIGVMVSTWCSCVGDYHQRIWTWGGTYSEEKTTINLTDNAVRSLTAEYLNGEPDNYAQYYLSFETDGARVAMSGYNYVYAEDMAGNVLIPADAGSYVAVDSDWDSERGCTVHRIWRDEIPAGEDANIPAWDFDREWAQGYYHLSGDATISYNLPGEMPVEQNVYGTFLVQSSSPDMKTSIVLNDNSGAEYGERMHFFEMELPMSIQGTEPMEVELSPLSAITLFTPGESSASEHTVLGVYLTDTNGMRYTDIYSGIYNGEVMERNGSEEWYQPTVYYREVGEETWTEVSGGSLTSVDLGQLPAGDYEAKAEFDFTEYELPENSNYPEGNYSVFLTSPVVEFTVGGSGGCKIAASAEQYGDLVRVILSGTPGAEAKVYASLSGEAAEQVGACVLSEEGLGRVLFAPKQSGTLRIYATAELNGQTATGTTITLEVDEGIPAPTLLKAQAAEAGSILVNCEWTAKEGITAVLYREGKKLCRLTESPAQYLDTGLEIGRIYTYSLVLEDSEGQQGEMLYTSARPAAEPDRQAPTVPEAFEAVLNGSSVTLSWGPSQDNDRVKAYIIYRNDEELTRIISRSYTDSGLGLGQTYTYAVAAVDPTGNISAKTELKTVQTSGNVSIDSIAWETERMVGNVIAGNSLRVNVKATSGLEDVRAEVHYYDLQGNLESMLLALKPYGQFYSAQCSLNGVAMIENITAGIYLDGTAAAKRNLDVGVKCIFRTLRVTLPEGDWACVPDSVNRDIKVTLNSKEAGVSSSLQMHLSGVQFYGLLPAEDYVMCVYWRDLEVMRQENLVLAPGASDAIELTDCGVQVLKINVLLRDGEEITPVSDVVYLNNRRYKPNQDGRVYDITGETGILLPAKETELKIRHVNAAAMDGTGYSFEQDTLPVVDGEVTFYASPLQMVERTVSVQEDGTPVSGVELLITQPVPGGTYCELFTTDASGTIRCSLLPNVAYTVQPRETYSFMQRGVSTIEKDGIYYAMDTDAEISGYCWSCTENLAITIRELHADIPLRILLTDAYGSPIRNAELSLYPQWTAYQQTAKTDAEGIAQFNLTQTTEQYQLILEKSGDIAGRTATENYRNISETERAAGTVNWVMKQSFAPEITGLNTGERAVLIAHSEHNTNAVRRLVSAGKQDTGFAVSGTAGSGMDYCLIPVTGASRIDTGSTFVTWMPEALKAIGASMGYADYETVQEIAPQENTCTLTLDPRQPDGEDMGSGFVYEFISNGKTALTLNANGAVTLRLVQGSEFTVRAYRDSYEYICQDMHIAVPSATAATVVLPMAASYLDVCLTDSDGEEHPDITKNYYLFDAENHLIVNEAEAGNFRLTAPPNVTGNVTMFVGFGYSLKKGYYYQYLNNNKDWTKVVFDRAADFNGQTIQVTAALDAVNAPKLSSITAIGHAQYLIANVIVEALDEEQSLVKLRYHRDSMLSTQRLVLPAEATEIIGVDADGVMPDGNGDVEFKISTAVLEAGASVCMKAEGQVLQEVVLTADSFAVSTQNSVSSTEIEFSEVKGNLPLIPDSGYFRKMPKDAPLLQAAKSAYYNSISDLNKCYLSYTTTRRDFEVSVNIDGIPVNYAYDEFITINGGSMIMTNLTHMTSPGYEESTGRIWQNSYQLERMHAFDSENGEGWLMLPYPEPESYPHTYQVSAMLRYADPTAEDGWHYETRTELVTVYDDTAYLRCYDFTHYDSAAVGYIQDLNSPTYWVRPKTAAELKDYHTDKTMLLYWNNTNLFTFRAYFAKPEEVESAWAVADVPDSCENYCIPLHYDEETGIWTGTGELGDSYNIPDAFCVNYVLKAASAGGDYPTVDVKDLTASLDAYQAELPEGWTAELTDPKEMSLEECLRMWEDYIQKVGTMRGTELDAYLTEFFGEDRIAPLPAVKITDEAGHESVFYSGYEIDPVLPDTDTGRRLGVQLADGSVEPLRIVNSETENSIACDIYGDLTLLMPDAAANQMSASGLSYLGAVVRGVKWSCELISGVLGVYTEVGMIVDGDAALFDNKDGWIKDLPPDAMEEYEEWQDKKFINDVLDFALGNLGALLPPSLLVTTVFDLWLFKKTNDVDNIYKEIAMRNRKYKELQERWKKTHPVDYDPSLHKSVDPSGYVFEAVESNRLEGVSATVLTLRGDEWVQWDSEAYGEGPNPQRTDADGIYGWNVSDGKWKVLFEKDGYVSAESEELTVPPAHKDVNVGMVSLAEPVLTATNPAPGGETVDFSFSMYMRTEDVLASAVLVYEGEELSASLCALDEAQTASGNKQAANTSAPAAGLSVAKTFRFTPEDALPEGASCFIRLKMDCRGYNGKLAYSGDGAFAIVPAMPAYQAATMLQFTEEGYAMPIHEDLNLAQTLSCDGEDYESRLVWESLSPNAFSVDRSGIVTTTGGGTGYIRVSCDGLTAICAVADYERSGRLIVRTLDTLTGETAAQDAKYWLEEGESYRVTAPGVPGMSADTAVLSGVMSGKTQTMTLSYTPTAAVYALSDRDGAMRLAFRDAMSGTVCLHIAGYDTNGKQLWTTAETVENPLSGTIVSIEAPTRSAKRIRLYVTDETGKPLTQPLELAR